MPKSSLNFDIDNAARGQSRARARAVRAPSRTFEILFVVLVGAICVFIVLAPAG